LTWVALRIGQFPAELNNVAPQDRPNSTEPSDSARHYPRNKNIIRFYLNPN
jgi:hypothetical protein